MFPVGAEIIPNPYNKIPGFSCYVERENNGRRAGPGGSDPHAVESLGTTAASAGPPQARPAPSGGIHFVPGFPVMAWPMIEWVLDQRYAHLHQKSAFIEKSVIVMGSMEATLTPLMLALEAAHAGVKVFSLPSVDHPEFGRHIELGVKGTPEAVNKAYPALLAGLHQFNLELGPELVR